MTWTPGPPTRKGYYWVRIKENNRKPMALRARGGYDGVWHVCLYHIAKHVLTFQIMGDECDLRTRPDEIVEHAPILEPEE